MYPFHSRNSNAFLETIENVPSFSLFISLRMLGDFVANILEPQSMFVMRHILQAANTTAQQISFLSQMLQVISILEHN